MVEWPEERRHRLLQEIRSQQRLADVPVRLLRELKESSAFSSLVESLLEGFQQKIDPQVQLATLVARIDQESGFGEYDPFVRELVLALASAGALQRSPSREVWEYLWSLAWHSASLEHLLPQAIVAAAADDDFRHQFFVVARAVVEFAAENPGRRAIDREKDVGRNLREWWKKNRQLSSLWRGNFDRSSFAVGRDDDHVLPIVAEIDANEFVRLLAIYDYPDPIAHAIVRSGALWRFERWRALLTAAPKAFEDDAHWNYSLVLPLLLSIARDQMQMGVARNSTPNEVVELTTEIKSVATEIAKIIASRSDAISCMTRWGNWLVRNIISAVSTNAVPYPTDAASRGFVEDTLLDAIIAELPIDRWSANVPSDAETWEPWSHFATGVLISLGGKAAMPDAESFIDEWRLSPEAWSTQTGHSLRQHAAPFEGAPPRADGYGARVLAVSMIELEDAAVCWRRFWECSLTLRELVEFGDGEESANAGWQSRSDAAELVMLQFSIGLMMLDWLIKPPRTIPYDRSNAVRELFPLLDEATREMTAIDQLNGKFWSEAIRHLAIRRVTWLADERLADGVMLDQTTKPTLADFLYGLSGDTEGLLTLLYVAHRNGVSDAILAAAFKEAGIDLESEIEVAERLLDLSKLINLDQTHLAIARQVAMV